MTISNNNNFKETILHSETITRGNKTYIVEIVAEGDEDVVFNDNEWKQVAKKTAEEATKFFNNPKTDPLCGFAELKIDFTVDQANKSAKVGTAYGKAKNSTTYQKLDAKLDAHKNVYELGTILVPMLNCCKINPTKPLNNVEILKTTKEKDKTTTKVTFQNNSEENEILLSNKKQEAKQIDNTEKKAKEPQALQNVTSINKSEETKANTAEVKKSQCVLQQDEQNCYMISALTALLGTSFLDMCSSYSLYITNEPDPAVYHKNKNQLKQYIARLNKLFNKYRPNEIISQEDYNELTTLQNLIQESPLFDGKRFKKSEQNDSGCFLSAIIQYLDAQHAQKIFLNQSFKMYHTNTKEIENSFQINGTINYAFLKKKNLIKNNTLDFKNFQQILNCIDESHNMIRYISSKKEERPENMFIHLNAVNYSYANIEQPVEMEFPIIENDVKTTKKQKVRFIPEAIISYQTSTEGKSGHYFAWKKINEEWYKYNWNSIEKGTQQQLKNDTAHSRVVLYKLEYTD